MMNICNYVKNMNTFYGMEVANLGWSFNNVRNYNRIIQKYRDTIWIEIINNVMELRFLIYLRPYPPRLSTFLDESVIHYFGISETAHSLSIWVFGW